MRIEFEFLIENASRNDIGDKNWINQLKTWAEGPSNTMSHVKNRLSDGRQGRGVGLPIKDQWEVKNNMNRKWESFGNRLCIMDIEEENCDEGTESIFSKIKE